RELVEVLILHREFETLLERGLRVVPLEGLARTVERVVVSAANLGVLLPRLGNRGTAEVFDEVTPHETRARARRDDPFRWWLGLELEDFHVLGLDLLDRGLLLLVPVLDLRLDVLENRLFVARTRVGGELHGIDIGLPLLLGRVEVGLANRVERLGEAPRLLT